MGFYLGHAKLTISQYAQQNPFLLAPGSIPRHTPIGNSPYSWQLPRTPSAELELELLQSHMTQKQVLRGEVGARALRV